MDNIIDNFLKFQVQTRILHWQTKSYARHKAYDQFYDSLSSLIDKFIEVHMGKYGRVKTGGSIELKNMSEFQIKDFLSEMDQFLISLSKKYDPRKDSDILNIRDEMLGSVNQLRYLLTLE